MSNVVGSCGGRIFSLCSVPGNALEATLSEARPPGPRGLADGFSSAFVLSTYNLTCPVRYDPTGRGFGAVIWHGFTSGNEAEAVLEAVARDGDALPV